MWERMPERAVGLIKASLSSPTSRITVSLLVVRSRSTVTVKMTPIETLATVLLAAGFFSLTAARGHFLPRAQFSPPELDDTPRSLDFYIQILDPENYVHLSREQCGDNDGSSVYDEVEASLQHFRVNVRTLVEPLRRETELALAHPRGRLPSVVRKYCRKVPTLQKYIKHVTHAINACLNRDEVQRVISGRYFANALLDYICEDGGNGLATFIADGGMECLASKKEELLNCANRNFGRYLSGAEFVGDGVSEVKGFEMLFALDTKRCSDVRAFQSCMTGVLNDCEEPTTAKALNDLIDELVIKLTSCEASRSEVEGHPSTIAQDVSSEDEEFEDFMLKKCEKNGGGPMAYDAIDESLRTLSRGYKMLELEGLFRAIDYAAFKSNGTFDLDSILAFYCRKVPVVIGLEKYFTETFKLCLEPDERLGVDIFQNVTSSLLEAACYNDGNAIAAFVVGDGPQCMEFKREELKFCAYQIFGGYFVAGGWKRRTTPETPFVVDYKDCEDMEKLRTCVGQVLADCDDKTAARMVDLMFDTIHDGMSCEELREGMRFMAMSDTEFKYESMKQHLLENCEKDAEPAAYEAVKNALRKIEPGAQLLIMNIERLEIDLRETKLRGELLPLLEKYCRKVPAFKKFINHARDSVEVCVPQDVRMDAEFKKDIIFSTIDFMCDDEGARGIKFLTSDAMDCIESKQYAVDRCIPSRYRADSGLVQLREDLDAKDCTNFKEVQHCVVEALSECDDPTASQTVDDLINSFMEDVVCHDSR